MGARCGTLTKKSALFAEVVKSTEIAKMAGVLGGPRRKSEATLKLYRRLARSRVDVTAGSGGRLMDGVTAASWHTVRFSRPAPARRRIQALEEAGDKETDFGKAVEAAKRARRAVVAFDKVSKMERPAREPAAPSRSRGGHYQRCRGKSR